MNQNKHRLLLVGSIVSLSINVILIIVVVILFAVPPVQKNNVVINSSTKSGAIHQFQLVDEVWNVINENYFYNKNLDPQKFNRGAAKGMVQALDDKYSVFLDPPEAKQESIEYSGNYQGIGAYVGSNKNNQLVIIAPMDGSPAKEAGLKTGDVILKINDVVTIDLSVVEASLLIQGKGGTEVTLLISREDQAAPFEVKLTRRSIVIPSVHYEINEGIASITLSQFLKNTGSELHKALQDISKQNVQGIILDLRNNPGGLLDQAINVASEFLDGGVAVKSLDNQGNYQDYRVFSGGLATKIKLLVLVNNGSASASEIVAGALQDYQRAKLVGQKTFGKGSVQVIIDLSDGSKVHLTTAQWITPNGRQISGSGLEPDIQSNLDGQDLINYASGLLKTK